MPLLTLSAVQMPDGSLAVTATMCELCGCLLGNVLLHREKCS